MKILVFLTFVTFASSANFSFPTGNPWNTDITNAAIDPNSANVISFLANTAGGWTTNLQIDFEMVLNFGSNAPMKSISGSSYGGYYTDCDPLTEFPYLESGYFESEISLSAYPTQCGYAEGGGDCHYIYVDQEKNYLWESFSTDLDSNGNFQSQCPVVWDLNRLYPAYGRGAFCTSADAAGFPIAPLLVTADELAAGEVNHAIRLILPNAKIQHATYVSPGSHVAGGSGGANAPPYGAHFRMKASKDCSTLGGKAAATVICNALKKYGLYLADGGNIPLTFASDINTVNKYANLNGGAGLDSHGLYGIAVTDFDLLDLGTVTTYTNQNCMKYFFDPTATQQYPTPVTSSSSTSSSSTTSSSSSSTSSSSTSGSGSSTSTSGSSTSTSGSSTSTSMAASTSSSSTSVHVSSTSSSSSSSSKCSPACGTGTTCTLGYCVCDTPSSSPTCLTVAYIGACGVQNACPSKTTCVNSQCACVTQYAFAPYVSSNTTYCQGSSSSSSSGSENGAVTLSIPMALILAGLASLFAL